MTAASPGFEVLNEGSAPPAEASLPPRQPRWCDTVAFMADSDRFWSDNLKTYGPIFRTGVFGGTTVFLATPEAVKMAFNGNNHYTEVSLFATTNAIFGEYSLFQRPDLHRVRKARCWRAAYRACTEPRLVHGWERLYPEPGRFDPERFLGNSMEAKLNPAYS